MPKEKIDYRDNLLKINAELGDVSVNLAPDALPTDPRVIIPIKEVSEWLGISVQTLVKNKRFPVKKSAVGIMSRALRWQDTWRKRKDAT